jgi:hypothetical protein
MDLCTLGIDTFLDSWELEVGQSLQRVLGDALERSRYVGLILSEHFQQSRWTTDEMAQALSRERRKGEKVVLPLLINGEALPPFIEDRVWLDFRTSYFAPLVRLAAAVHGVPKQRLELVLQNEPKDLVAAVDALQGCGQDLYMVVDGQDYQEIIDAGGRVEGDRVICDPAAMKDNPRLSPAMKRYVQLWLQGHGLIQVRPKRTRTVYSDRGWNTSGGSGRRERY